MKVKVKKQPTTRGSFLTGTLLLILLQNWNMKQCFCLLL